MATIQEQIQIIMGVRAAYPWGRRIARAAKHNGFTPGDRSLAHTWESCAVGEQLPEMIGPPSDLPRVLICSGLEFLDAVWGDWFVDAANIYVQICDLADQVPVEVR